MEKDKKRREGQKNGRAPDGIREAKTAWQGRAVSFDLWGFYCHLTHLIFLFMYFNVLLCIVGVYTFKL